MTMAMARLTMNDKIWRVGDIVEPAVHGRLLTSFVPGSCGWYIVYVAGGDSRATMALERRGYTVYRPMVQRWVPVKRRGGLRADRTQSKLRKGKAWRKPEPTMQRISVPLYPQYVFVAIDPRRGTWWDLTDIPGVAAVIRHNSSEVVRLADDVISGMKGIEERGTFDEAKPAKTLKPKAGTKILVVSGPFASFAGVVVNGGDPATVICEVFVFGGSTPVSMPLDHVEVV